jgi:carbonic anhydrase
LKTITKQAQSEISPTSALVLLKKGNQRFVDNLKVNRNLLQQVNETSEGQHPFAVIISCMDSRTSAELVFDQGLGDIFSIRIAGNVINQGILASAEFGCKVVGAKIIVVLGHTKCGAIKGSIDNVDLGYLHVITGKVRRCMPPNGSHFADNIMDIVTKGNVKLGIEDIRVRSEILNEMECNKEISIVGGVYDVSTGVVEFFE